MEERLRRRLHVIHNWWADESGERQVLVAKDGSKREAIRVLHAGPAHAQRRSAFIDSTVEAIVVLMSKGSVTQ